MRMTSRRQFTCLGLASSAMFSAFAAFADDTQPIDPLNDIRGRRLETRSFEARNRSQYRLIFSIPSGDAPPAGFPVIYVLDGDAHAPLVGDIARLNESNIGPILVVGIGYPGATLYNAERRSYDYTPPGALGDRSDPEMADFKGMSVGGADRLRDILEGEIKPAVAAQFKIDRARQALFGHSLGGLFVIYDLFTNPGRFCAYVAASPAIWWNNRAVLKLEPAFAARAPALKDLRVLITVGGNEGSFSAFSEWKMRKLAAADPSYLEGGSLNQMLDRYRKEDPQSNMVGNARAIARRLKTLGLDAVFVEFPGEEHSSELVDAYNRGIFFALGPRL